MADICIYYDDSNSALIDILPKGLEPDRRARIEQLWNQHIPRRLLIYLSTIEQSTVPQIKDSIGHSMSTLHENLSRLEAYGLITTEMIYSGNKQKIIRPNVICVTRNPKHKEKLARFFQGLWVDSGKTKKIVGFLQENKDEYFSPEQISLKTGIPVDEVEMLLNNFDSVATKGLSNAFRDVPFEKKVMYRGR
jgi:DNA-binding PadR family transcriptional regulator